MGVRERLSRENFTRLVEVFPPGFNVDPKVEPVLGLKQKARDFVERIRRIQNLADAVVVADVKDLSRLKLSTVFAAALLKAELGVEAIPVFTARDSNRAATRSGILTALSQGLDTVMLVWGDRYPERDGASNVYDYPSLADLISEAKALARRSGVELTVLAPIDLAKLNSKNGRRLARDRLEKGASHLLAQPPTTDSFSTLPSHMKLLQGQRLESRVFLNVFPFRGPADITYCREKFGWQLPTELDALAADGEPALLKEAKRVAEMAEERGAAGIYVSTRGRPELARFILD